METKKLLLFEKEARQKLASGADKLSRAVVSTLGPRSRNVAISFPSSPRVYHDGVSVALNIRLSDPFEDIGAVLLREASFQTNVNVGDGTTTSTLLANTLVQEGLKLVDGGIVDGMFSGKVNPMELRERLEKAITVIIKQLDGLAIPITERKDYEQVANISSGFTEIGKLVADAIEKGGKESVIFVEEADSFESTVEFEDGLEFDNGYLNQYMVTDPDRMIAEYKDAYILLTDWRIADAMSLVPIIEKVAKEGKPLLIIADDVIGPALQALVLSKIRKGLPLIAVMAPEFADRRKEMLEDIAVLTDGTVISSTLNKKLEDVSIADLGKARSIVVTATHTRIIPLEVDQEDVRDRIESIKDQMKEETNAYRKQRLEYRLGKLANKVAIIKVGSSSEANMKEKRERAIDAVHATKAALSQGVVAGGGVTLRDIANDWKITDAIDELIVKTLRSPYERILTNSGITDIKQQKKGFGTNVVTQKVVSMIDEGIIDPVKVTKLAVEKAFSVAAVMLTTDTLIVDDPEQEKKNEKNYFQ